MANNEYEKVGTVFCFAHHGSLGRVMYKTDYSVRSKRGDYILEGGM